jgi:hypothetical protein
MTDTGDWSGGTVIGVLFKTGTVSRDGLGGRIWTRIQL